MGYRLSKIYTKTGDTGTTSLDGKTRLAKNNPRLETIGTIDELNCAIGLTLAEIEVSEVKAALTAIQHTLFDVGGELTLPDYLAIKPEHTEQLENWIDDWNKSLPPLKEFILPSGNKATAHCHLARAICRRAERSLISLHQEEPCSAELLRYLNRLSDVLFVAARILAKENFSTEIMWEHERGE